VILMGRKDALSSIPVKPNTFPLEPPFLPGLDGYASREHKK